MPHKNKEDALECRRKKKTRSLIVGKEADNA